MQHFKNSGRKASIKDISQAKDLVEQIGRCIGARRRRDWERLLSDSKIAVAMGADSAPQVKLTYIYIYMSMQMITINRLRVHVLL